MYSLSAFLPNDRRHALNAGRSMPDRVRGAALFADISGFTPLTATLRHELGARRGAEELVRHLDRLFADLIEQIHLYRGAVIGFSGDAVTCWFDDTEAPAAPDLAPAAVRAVACAQKLQAVIASLGAISTPSGTEIPIAIKVAIAGGPARRFLVGDPQTYVIEVLAGATLDRMAAAEKVASRGEIVVSADILDSFDTPLQVGEWRDGAGERFAVVLGLARPLNPPSLEMPPLLPDEVARPWLLPPVYNQLRQGAAEFLAQLRPAVPVFVKFSGIDYDGDDEAGVKLDAFVRRAQAVLNHYEGYLLQIIMGDKGSYLYITFGAPVAHEKDTERAVAAALDLQKLPAELPYLHPLRIGISRGLIHSGAYGSRQRRTYAVMGNEVNISARLMSAAQPGQVLVSARVAEATGHSFILNRLPPIILKGIPQPFELFELTGRKAPDQVSLQPAMMIGREMEQAQLARALDQLTGGASSVLIIEGAAGIGKSLFIRQLATLAENYARPPRIYLGAGDAIERSTPYFAWRPIFERLIAPEKAGDEMRSTAILRERLLDRLSSDNKPLAPLLNSVLPLDLPETERTEQITGEARQQLTHQLLIDLLAQDGSLPRVLVFDDTQWLDSVSWVLIQRVQRELSPVLLAIVTRTVGEEAPPVFTELRELPATRHISLDTLPPQAIEELVCRRLGVRRLPPAVARLIHNKAEGHPFFSEELAFALRDAGLILIENGECRLAPGADLEALDFPTTIQGVITSRIDRLPPQQQLTVKVASVIGRIFAFRALISVYPVEAAQTQLQDHLEQLNRLNLTSLEMPEPNLAYIFKHIVTQEVVYGLMTYAQRQQLHRNTALWYEGPGETDPNRSLPLLAHHWRMAGEKEKAADYYERAGDNAFRDYANQEAIRFLDLAEELNGDTTPAPQRARRHRLMGEAYYRLTSLEECLASYRAALALLKRPLPGSTAGRGLGLTREMVRQAGYRLLPGRSVGRAGPEERDRLLEAARVLEGAGEIYYNLGDFLTSFYCTMTAFNLAERAGPSPELMRGYANMCATFGTVNLNSIADSYRNRALKLEPAIDDLSARAWSRISLSTHSTWVGNWDRAEKEIGEALELYTQLGDWRRWSVAAWLLPQVAQSRGQLERARDLWAELLAVALRSRDTRHQVRSRGGQFFNFLSLDQPDEAHDCLTSIAEILRENPDMLPVEERLWHAMNAAWAWLEGDVAQARENAAETLAAIGRARFKFDLLDVFATPAEVFLALWEKGEATGEEAKAALKAMTGYARTYAFGRPRALRIQGRYARLAGDPQHAAKFFAKSLAQADALRMPHERKLTEAMIEQATLG